MAQPPYARSMKKLFPSPIHSPKGHSDTIMLDLRHYHVCLGQKQGLETPSSSLNQEAWGLQLITPFMVSRGIIVAQRLEWRVHHDTSSPPLMGPATSLVLKRKTLPNNTKEILNNT